MASPDFDPYAVLGVPTRATPDEIRAAYRRLAAECHPDTQPSEKKAWASEQMIQLNSARDLLLNPRRRARYHREPIDLRPRSADKNRWREQEAQAAYTRARPGQTASSPARRYSSRLVYTLILIGLLGLGLYFLPGLIDFFQNPAAGLHALSGAFRQFQANLISLGYNLLAVLQVLVFCGLLALALVGLSRRRRH